MYPKTRKIINIISDSLIFRQEILAKSKIALGLMHLRPESSTMDYMVF